MLMVADVAIHGLLLGMLVLAWTARDELREAFADLPRSAWIGLGTGLLGWWAMVQALVPHSIWSTYAHGFGRYVDIRDGYWPLTGAAMHGHGTGLVLATLPRLTGGLISPFDAAALAATATLGLVFLWAFAWYRSVAGATVAAATLAATPVFVRLAPTTTQYVPCALWLAAALLGTQLFARSGSARSGALAAIALSLLAQTRAEMLLFGPLMIGSLALLHRPGLPAEVLRRRDLQIVIGGLGLSMVPWLVALQGFGDPRTGAGGLRWITDPALDRWLLALAALRLLAGPVRGWRAPTPIVLSLGLLLATRGTAILGTPRLDELHPLWESDYSAPVLPAVVGLGAAALWWTQPLAALYLTACWYLPAHLYRPSVDSASTFVRTGLVGLPFFALAAGAAGRAITDLSSRLPRPAARLAPAGAVLGLVLALGAGLRDRWEWVTWIYPRNQELALLIAARDHIGPGDVVVTLGPNDHPPDLDRPERFAQSWALRAIAAWVLGGDDLESAGDPSAHRVPEDAALPFTIVGTRRWLDGDAPTGGTTWYYRGLACARVHYAADGTGIRYAGVVEAVPQEPVIFFDRSELHPEHLAIVRGREVEDPWCRALEARVPLEPVLVERVHAGNLGAASEEVWGADAHIGLYRVLGPPKPPEAP